MFKALLNADALSINSLILNIVIILGVVIAGALIVYFVWELVSALVAKTKKGDRDYELNLDDVKPNNKEEKKEEFVSDYTLDAEEEKVVENNEEGVLLIDENKLEEVDLDKAEEEKTEVDEQISNEERENAERRAYLEARRQELIKRIQAEIVDNVEEEEKTETAETEKVDEVEEDAAVPVDLEETLDDEEEAELEEVTEPEVDALAEERQRLAAEQERYETMIKELEEAKKALAEQTQVVAVAPVVAEPVVASSGLSLEELEEKLALAEERLKVTEKEFKQCKKEYIPLRRVWETHEKDAKKLRRKEALVAKQKVLLYGVNNYADIDEEKAQKLAEDLDLLDGLKLSVQHCEEVMKKNEERYPLLEKMYNVLKLRDDELKNDIASYKEEIAKLQADQNQNAEN